MADWDCPQISKDVAFTNLNTVLSIFLMARTKQAELWSPALYQRARQWALWIERLCLMLSTSSNNVEIDRKRSNCILLLDQWSRKATSIDKRFKTEISIAWLKQAHFQLIKTLLDNPVISDNIKKLILVDIPALKSSASDPSAEQIQNLLSDQSSQHGTIDLLVNMNDELDALLCEMDDYLQIKDQSNHKLPSSTNLDDLQLISMKTPQKIVSTSFCNAILKDNEFLHNSLSTLDSEAQYKKLFDDIEPFIATDNVCLETLLLVINQTANKTLVTCLLSILSKYQNLPFLLWRCQDPDLLQKISSKMPLFFKAYLAYLVQNLKQGNTVMESEFGNKIDWYDAFTKGLVVIDDYKSRIRSLLNNPRLKVATKKYLEKHMLFGIEQDNGVKTHESE